MTEKPNKKQKPNGTRKRSKAAPVAEPTESGVDPLRAMSNSELAAEYASMLRVIAESEKALAQLPRPFPPEMTGYRSPAFHLYLDRKYLRRIEAEIRARGMT